MIPIIWFSWWLYSLVTADFLSFLAIPASFISPVISLASVPLSAMTGQHVTDISNMLNVIIGGTIWTILVLVLARGIFGITAFSIIKQFFRMVGKVAETVERKGDKLIAKFSEWQIEQDAWRQRQAMEYSLKVQEKIIEQEMEERENIYKQQ